MEHVSLILIGLLSAALLGQWLIPHILIISSRKRLFDVPDVRKVHHSPISRLGGVTFFPVIMLVMCGIVLLRFHLGGGMGSSFGLPVVHEMLCLLIGLMLLYLTGVCDDLIGVPYSRKFLIQFLASVFIPLSGLILNHFYGLFGIGEIALWIAIPLTMFLTVFITNSINLIDGIDGLASSLCMVALLLFGIGFARQGLWMYALFSFVSMGVLIPFFFYNVFGNANRGRKIFMGDTGSLTLGFILSFLSVKYITVLGENALIHDGTSIVLVFSVLLVPCLDVCRVVLERLQRGKHPFKPDKSHIHHKFLNMGFTPRHSLILIQLLSVTFIGLTYMLIIAGVSATIVLLLDLIAWTLVNALFNQVINKRRYALSKQAE